MLLGSDVYAACGKQAIGNNVVTVGYIMKPSREEDFAKVSPLINEVIIVVEKEILKQKRNILPLRGPYNTIDMCKINSLLKLFRFVDT